MALRSVEERRSLLEKTLLDPQIQNDQDLQTLAVVQARDVWPTLSDDARRNLLGRLAGLLPRIQVEDAAAPEMAVRQLLELPTELDARRAVKSRYQETRANYIWGPNEDIYREITGLGKWYLDYAKHNYAPLGFHLWTFVTVLGAICKRQVYYDTGQGILHPNYYTFLAGDSSSGKSHAAKIGIDLLRRVNYYICPSENEVEQSKFAGKLTTILPGDATIPGLMVILKKVQEGPPVDQDLEKTLAFMAKSPQTIDAAGLLWLDELATFLGKNSHDVDLRAPWLTAMKEATIYEKMTKTDGKITLRNCTLSVLACCAFSWLRQTISPAVLQGGLADRSLYITRQPVWERVTAKQYSPTNLPVLDPVEEKRIVDALVRITELPYKLVPGLSQEAKSLSDELYIRIAKEAQARDAAGITAASSHYASPSRTFNDVLRLAMMLALSDSLISPDWPKTTVEDHHIDLAFRLVLMEQEGMNEFISKSQEPQASEPERVFNRAWVKLGDRCVSRSDFNHTHMKPFGRKEAIPLMLEWMDQGRVEVVKLGRKVLYKPAGHTCPECIQGVYVTTEEMKRS